ncbi:MAG: hypothetical protein WC872_00085 [Candidatus Absconditabacterales bacterium]
MNNVKEIHNTLENNKYLIFYKIMNYPVPLNSDFLLFEKNLTNLNLFNLNESNVIGQNINNIKNKFSWSKKNYYLDEYINFINKYHRLYKSIPFISSIYLCNSITFNSLKENSDIDIFIVTKKGSMRRARLFSFLFFSLFFIKRGVFGVRKKFCLSFYVSSDYQNLYNILLSKTDIYLPYRLAHLVPIYQEKENNIYKYNKWINSFIPNFPGKHIINIGSFKSEGKTKLKILLEFMFGGIFGRAVEFIIKIFWLPINIYKKNKLKAKGRGIIINDNMLKFYLDKREKISLLYKIYKKNFK